MKLQRSHVAAIFVSVFGICAPTVAKDFNALMASENARWLAAYNKRDAQAFGPMYAQDAVMLPQGSPPIEGRTAIVQFWFEMFKKDFRNPTLEIVSSGQEGNLAYQTCRWSVLEPAENGPPKKLSGNTLRIFERQRDGRWLIKVQMSNSDETAVPEKSGIASVLKVLKP
jgi:uncharacterized protein (TIGR02246 family)